MREIKSVKGLFTVLFMLLVCSGAFGAAVKGTIAYMEGTVDIYRDGKLLDWGLVDTGFTVREYDLVTTGDDGLVELDLTMPSGTSAVVTINAGTSFYFELKNTGGKNKTAVRMLTGAMKYKVQKLASKDALQVQTVSAAMGVRGTTFQVVYSPGGGVLVLCSEGQVAVDDRKGNSRYSEPGSVVEKVPEKGIAAYKVSPGDLSLYRSYWTSSRDKIFKAGADVFIKGFSKQFLLYRPRFEKAYSALLAEKKALVKYGRDGSSFPLGVIIQTKSKVSPAVVEMRSILPVYEMVYYRLKVLEGYHAEGIGHSVIEKGLTSEKFFSDFKEAESRYERELADVRYMFKLYSAIHGKSGGGPSILDKPFGGMPSGSIPKSSFPSR